MTVDFVLQPIYTNCGIAIKDWIGDRERNELMFTVGALITNIHNKSAEWAIGDHRGDKQKYFRPNHIQLLTKDELAYINDLVREEKKIATKIPCHQGFPTH